MVPRERVLHEHRAVGQRWGRPSQLVHRVCERALPDDRADELYGERPVVEVRREDARGPARLGSASPARWVEEGWTRLRSLPLNAGAAILRTFSME